MELSGEALAGFFATVMPHLDERQTRVVAGAMVKALGRGGQARVVEASALSSSTVNRATREVEAGLEVSDRQRVPGAGAKPVTETQPHLLSALDDLVAPETRGNPMSLLRWTLKSTYGFGQGSAAGGVQGVGGITVGTALAGGPPCRSQRALLTHWAPALDTTVEACFGEGVHDAGWG